MIAFLVTFDTVDHFKVCHERFLISYPLFFNRPHIRELIQLLIQHAKDTTTVVQPLKYFKGSLTMTWIDNVFEIRWAFWVFIYDKTDRNSVSRIYPVSSCPILMLSCFNEDLVFVKLPRSFYFITKVVNMAGDTKVICHSIRDNKAI